MPPAITETLPTRAPSSTGGRTQVTMDVDQAAWDAYVESHDSASGYHLWRWRGVFERAFGHRTVYFGARRDGALVGVLPLVEFHHVVFGHFAVSLPFVNSGGILANDAEATRALSDTAIDWASARRLSHVELRHEARLLPELQAKQHKVSMRLPLPGSADMLWQSLDRKVRNQVRKAEKSGLTAIDGGIELMDGFYTVFAENMRDLGTPVYPRRWFEDVMRTFPERTRIFQVRLGEEVVAASLTFSWRNSVEVPSASSLRAHRDKSPNNLLYWSMLRRSVEGGAQLFDFGRSTPEEGTYHFKKQWGAEPGPMFWEYWLRSGSLPDQSPGNPKFRLAISAWQRLPVWVANRLGPPIVRHLP